MLCVLNVFFYILTVCSYRKWKSAKKLLKNCSVSLVGNNKSFCLECIDSCLEHIDSVIRCELNLLSDA